MLALLTLLAEDAATEGKKVITAMLIVGLVFIGVILLGEGTHTLSVRRKARKRRRAAY
jgi:hypothetical protein